MLEAVEPIRVRHDGQSHELQPGQRIDLPEDKGRLLLERAPGRVRVVMGGRKAQQVHSAPTGGNSSSGSMLPCPVPHANNGNVPMPGTRIVWMRGDGERAQGTVIEILIDPLVDQPITLLVTLNDDSWAVLNPRVVRFEVVEGR